MREIIKKEALRPAASLRFLYGTGPGRCLLGILCSRRLSQAVGKFLDSRFSKVFIRGFIRRNRIDMSQYEQTSYRSFNDFFTRRIRPECRPFDFSPEAFVSPCDAKLSVFPVDEGSRFEIKGFSYSVEELLKDKTLAEKYEGGLCFVFRLGVEDYHRYFYIDDGVKGENVFIPGKLHTVQPAALEKRRVFAENCREYTSMQTEHFGLVTQTEVGAMMVGRIVNNDGAGECRRGKEKGRFEFGGSTVVLLVEKDRVTPDEELVENTRRGDETAVKCGERLGVASRPAAPEGAQAPEYV